VNDLFARNSVCRVVVAAEEEIETTLAVERISGPLKIAVLAGFIRMIPFVGKNAPLERSERTSADLHAQRVR
jgi:hypothetical protein